MRLDAFENPTRTVALLVAAALTLALAVTYCP